MTIATKETFSYEAVLAEVETLSPEQQVRLIFTLAKRFSPGLQTKLIVMLLPDVAPTIEAVLRNQVARPTPGTAVDGVSELLKTWEEEKEEDDDDGVWDEIMQRLGAYETNSEQI